MDKYEPSKIRTSPSARTLSSRVKYEPSKIEPKWQKRWEKERIYRAIDFDKRPKKYILIEFPYPSGERLHVGHGRSYSALDALSRKLRMQGFNVLYPLGWDAFGLPTENYAIKMGVNPAEATAQNIKISKNQAKSWGLGIDWSREINTTTPKYYKWTQWIFLKMYEKGLAYKAKVPVSWCPACKINLANEEVIAGKCERCGALVERRTQSQWMLRITKYAQRLLDDLVTVDYLPQIKLQQENWIGRSEGTEIKFKIVDDQFHQAKRSTKRSDQPSEAISVFTTRSDTLFGVTAMVLAPEHPFLGELTKPENKKAIEEYLARAENKSELERTDLSKEKTGVFTGSYCINPINNEKIPIWVGDYVIGWYGGGAVMVVPAHDSRDFDFAKKYSLEIREVVSGGDIIQSAFEGEGTLVSSGDFSGQKSTEARENITKWLEEHQLGGKTVVYKLRDWVFSRQHYWGEPIPVIHCEKCGVVPVPEKNLPVELPYLEKYEPSGTGESPLIKVEEWVNVACPKCDGPARRETDTMPNWAGSNWYYLAYVFAHKLGNQKSKIKNQKEKNIFEDSKDLLQYWLPVDLYNGGMEHTTLHLLYSRFVYKFLSDIGVVPGIEPYTRRHSHGVVLGPDGQKMSKSQGNVVNPDDVVKAYGADTFRLYEMFLGPFEQMVAWSEEGISGCHRFLKRVWQLSQEKVKNKTTPNNLKTSLHQTIKKVSEDVDSLKFNTAIAAMMEFINGWAKPGAFLSKDEAKLFLQILAPFAPHITEELWSFDFAQDKQSLPSDTSSERKQNWSIHQQPWPEYDPKLAQEEIATVVVQINGKMRDKLELKSERAGEQEEVEKQAMANEKIKSYLEGKKIKKVVFIPGKLINFVI